MGIISTKLVKSQLSQQAAQSQELPDFTFTLKRKQLYVEVYHKKHTLYNMPYCTYILGSCFCMLYVLLQVLNKAKCCIYATDARKSIISSNVVGLIGRSSYDVLTK